MEGDEVAGAQTVPLKVTLKILFFLIIALPTPPAAAQELFVNGGVMQNSLMNETEGQWSVMYRQGLGRHLAFGLTYINEAHRTSNYRDGLSAQLWGQTTVGHFPLSAALGIGPYAFFDTRFTPGTDSYHNAHDFGILSSATATWQGMSPWLLQLRIDYITNNNTYDTLSATAGIGYLLAAPSSPGSPPLPAGRIGATDSEIALYLGAGVINSNGTEQSLAGGIEYRRSLAAYLHWTIAILDEGDTRTLGRYGIATQLWAVRSFLDSRLELGIGAGPYLARDKNGDGDGKPTTTVAGDVSVTAAYRFHPRLSLRATWSRIITDYSRDTDLFLGGLAYRF